MAAHAGRVECWLSGTIVAGRLDAQLLLDSLEHGAGGLTHEIPIVLLQLGRWESEFAKANHVVAHPIIPAIDVGQTHRAPEAVHPAQEGQAERASAILPKLLVDITFFAAKATKLGIEARPDGAPTTEQTQTLHGNVEGRGVGIPASLIHVPAAKHAAAPGRSEVGGDGL